MHTYNDAIRRTVGSYVLYPGSSSNCDSEKNTFKLFDEILPGVGAFSIKPSMDALGENELKSFIVSVIESRGTSNSRLNRLKYYTEMILKEPSIYNSQLIDTDVAPIKKGDMYVMGYIRGDLEGDYYNHLKNNSCLLYGKEFLFYFYAIKGSDVYSHHKDIFKASYFRFYTNNISETKTYILEPFLCKIVSNELISRQELVNRLCSSGYKTEEKQHNADYYYVLKVKVESTDFQSEEISVDEVNNSNGNDAFSLHSPKVLFFKG